MTSFHLFADPAADILQIELSLFGMHLGEEQDVEQNVPEFFTHVRARVGGNGVGQLIGFFEQEANDGARGLLAIPGAPVRPLSRSMIRINSSIAADGPVQFRSFHAFFNSSSFVANSRLTSLATTVASLSETRDT